MATIGNEEYPEYTLTECLHWVEKVKRDKIQTFDTLVGALGHGNPKSSGVGLKMASLGKYWGLLTKDGKAIRLTPLAEKIVYDMGDSARTAAFRELVGRVKVLSQLYAKLGPDYNPRDFNPVLHEVTGAKPDELEQKADRVERLYKDSIQYFRGAPSGVSPPSSLPPHLAEKSKQTPSLIDEMAGGVVPPLAGSPEDFHIYQTGDSYMRLRKDPEVLAVAKGVIEVWLGRMRPKTEKQLGEGEPADSG
jgi:hypothetical protein